MIELGKEAMEELSEFEKEFKLAIKSNFVRMDGQRFGRVAALYTKYCGVTLTKSQMTCSVCRLNAMKALGQVYFENQERMAAEEVEEEKKKRKGRPRKIDLGE